MKLPLLVAVVATPVLIFLAGGTFAQSTDGSVAAPGMSVPADNTKSNKEEPSNRTRTADDQKNNALDIKIAQEIRRSVMTDKSLSTYAHNTKIVSINGNVTLNGVVRSEAEKTSVGQKAAEVAGNGHVVNDIKVEPEK
jgi:osmotically-inducible protein OsmY